MCVFLAFFTKQHKTDQKVYKTHKTNKIKIRFVQSAQYGAVHLSLTQKMSAKNTRKTRPKHCKHPQNTAKHCFSKNNYNCKTPQNTRKTPQNTAKHRKTPQNTFANKTDRIIS